MPGYTIAHDATIADIVGQLTAPNEYVREVLQHMWECKLKHHTDTTSVRIAVTGRGRAPHYRVEYENHPTVISIFEFYRGSGHKEFEDLGEGVPVMEALGDDDPEVVKPDRLLGRDRTMIGDHWSSRAMNLDEVRVLLGDLRRRKR